MVRACKHSLSQMKMKFLKFATTSSMLSLALFSLGASKAVADGIFRPDTFKVTFYEIGLRDSSSGTLNPILDESSGVEVDLSNAGQSLSLASGKTPASGQWDQLYVLIKNSFKVSGGDGTGCYIQDGASAIHSNGTTAIVTSNSSQSGEGTSIHNDYGTPGDYGPYSPSITSSVNGSAVSNLKEYLVSSTNPSPNGGGTINRYLYIGDITPVTISSSSGGSVIYTIDTSQAAEISGSCGGFSFGNLTFNMSVTQN